MPALAKLTVEPEIEQTPAPDEVSIDNITGLLEAPPVAVTLYGVPVTVALTGAGEVIATTCAALAMAKLCRT